MKNFFVSLFATLVAMVLFTAFFCLAGFLVFVLFAAAGAPRAGHAQGAVLTIDLSDPIDDRGGAEDPFGLFGGRFSTLRLADVTDAIVTAADDPSIRGIFLHGSVSGSWAQARELRQALLAFKESDKPIYAYFPDYEEA
ncbi:MAG: hypothetical protein HZA52_01205 [Planctomycetes bacterium]|nr:hypothetical protein [Planctomycetota bacterium]